MCEWILYDYSLLRDRISLMPIDFIPVFSLVCTYLTTCALNMEHIQIYLGAMGSDSIIKYVSEAITSEIFSGSHAKGVYKILFSHVVIIITF